MCPQLIKEEFMMQNTTNTTTSSSTSSNTITIIKIEPNKDPEIITINNNLQVLQGLVDGYLEMIKLSPTVSILVNEDGRLRSLAPNIRLHHTMLLGTILIVGTKGTEMISLSSSQIKQYIEQLKNERRL